MPVYINPYRLFVGCFVPNWLMEMREASYGAKLCYAKLCQISDKTDGVAWPLQADLAAAMCVDVRTVRRYTAELADLGLIEIQSNASTSSPNSYRFLSHPAMGESFNQVDEPVQPPRTNEPSPPGRNGPDNKEENHKDKNHSSIVGFREEAVAFLATMNAAWGTRYRASDTTLDPISGRLGEGWSVEQLALVALHKGVEWGSDVKMAQYLRPATVYRASKFPGYLKAATLWDSAGRPGPRGNELDRRAAMRASTIATQAEDAPVAHDSFARVLSRLRGEYVAKYGAITREAESMLKRSAAGILKGEGAEGGC